MNWYFPSWYGDFRLIESGPSRDASAFSPSSTLKIEKVTPSEQKVLAAFLAKALKKKWIDDVTHPVLVANLRSPLGSLFEYLLETRSIPIAATVAEAGKVLLKLSCAHAEQLTALKFADGKVEATHALEALERASPKPDVAAREPVAAVSAPKPVVGCPSCEVGAVRPASEVLQAFLTPQQHEDWAKTRSFVVRGNESGDHYLLAHRHSRRAAKQTRVAYNLDTDSAVCLYALTLPPEEEVLSAKLWLEHRESEVVPSAKDPDFAAAFAGCIVGGARRTAVYCERQEPGVHATEDHLLQGIAHPPRECWCGGEILTTRLQ